jgi:hypothetical protein
MSGPSIRKFLTLGVVAAWVCTTGCAADPQKPKPKSSHHVAAQNDFPSAAEAGLAPTSSVTK